MKVGQDSGSNGDFKVAYCGVLFLTSLVCSLKIRKFLTTSVLLSVIETRQRVNELKDRRGRTALTGYLSESVQ
jgi:hypothetical protein